MSISAVAYVVSIAIGRYMAPDIEVFQIVFLRERLCGVFHVAVANKRWPFRNADKTNWSSRVSWLYVID